MHHYDAHTTSGVIFIKYLSSIVIPTHVSELAAVLAGAGQLAGQAVPGQCPSSGPPVQHCACKCGCGYNDKIGFSIGLYDRLRKIFCSFI